MADFIQIHENDNVCVALKDLPAGTNEQNVVLLDNINRGHKIALKDIKTGEQIIKYGQCIGEATTDIKKGCHVHTHNMKTCLSGVKEYSYNPVSVKQKKLVPPYQITGYKRSNGSVGIRNELWVIVTVGCINSVAKKIINAFQNQHTLDDIDGIYTFEHPYGCSQMGQDHINTVKILQDIVTHPNAGGVLVMGLGCENNQLKAFYEGLSDIDQNRIHFFNAQDVNDEIEEGIRHLEEIYNVMRQDQREPISFSDLTFGLKCGGSDGFSGITANPLLGRFSDRMLSYGANIILTEVPEMFGAEHLLMNRARDKKVFDDIVSLINNYKEYFIANNQVVYENPSPGNKAGGITTLEDKSCGCIQKAGSSIIDGTIDYGDKRIISGLNLLYGPGNDLVSTTAMGAAGAQMVLFTTGRGTPFGGFIPTVKVATNSEIYTKKEHWFDYNAGVCAEGKTLDEACDELVDLIINIINGNRSSNERLGYKEIAIFKQGVTL